MENIVNLIRNTPVEKAPTEKAQIVLVYNSLQQPTIMRFNSVKKAEKEYEKLKKAWTRHKSDGGSLPADVDGDMFVATVDLSTLATTCFVDLAKHAKFVPWQAPTT